MKTVSVNNLDSESVTQAEAGQVMGGYKLKNVYVTSYSVGGTQAGFTGGVRVASGDVNG